MTDVRLTATNPEDSSVVAVACNAKGELKLEEVPVFDGNVDGDLTVSGSATFAANKARITTSGGGIFSDEITINSDTTSAYFARFNSSGNTTFMIEETPDTSGVPAVSGILRVGKAANGVSIAASGSAQFSSVSITPGSLGTESALRIFREGNPSPDFAVTSGGKVDAGSVTASQKAGFTTEGYLWCTTRRGDTVILDFTSNGMATWVPYSPPNRLTELQDRWAEKDGILPVPHESSQDEPETPQ